MRSKTVAVDPRKSPTQARAKALVEAILDATARVLVEEGFAGTTTNRVAQCAGVSIGSLYQYFPNREALVAAVARRHSERLKARLETALDHVRDSDVRNAIDRLLIAVHDAHTANPRLSAVLATEVPKLGSMSWKKQIDARGTALVRTVLERHADELRPDLDRELVAFIVSTLVEALINAAARQRTSLLKSDVLRHALVDMLVRYVRRDR